MVIPNRLDAGTNRTADEDGTFQWPPPKDDVTEVFRFPDDGTEPGQANATLAETPKPHDATQPAPRDTVPFAPGITPRTPDQEDAEYLRLQEALRQPPKAEESTRQTNPPAKRQLERPGVRRPAGAWLRSHRFGLAFALLALVAGLEGLYILRPGWFRTTTPATVVPEEPPAPAPQAPPAETAEGRPTDATESTGTTGAARAGRLSIRSEPSGAQVSIDGRSYGVTPLTLAAVTPGERRIVLKLDGREVRQTVRVEAGGTASVIAPMRQVTTSSTSTSGTSGTSGWIAIASKAELDIFENGVFVGSTRSPQVMMPTGQHTLRLVNETLGYERTQQIRVEAGKVAQVSVALPDSTIHLNAQPWAEVWIDGKSVGETPIGNLPLAIGTHQIVFRHPELGEKTVSTVVKVGAPTRVTVDLRK
jgi:hypothetical protein